MNILNLIILLFILGMAYWWSTQGLFSSLLHLVAVIVAGTLSFALWEVIALDLLMPISVRYAWPAGLLAPFILLLLGVRMAMDKAVKGNVHFSQVINLIGGGALGIFSGILTAGITLIGISFLPVGPSMAGYQPLTVTDTGGIQGQAGDSLLIPVDKQAAGFFSMLSSGAFAPYSNTPLRVYQPELATQAQLYRMSYDPNASPAADPAKVQVKAYVVAPTPVTAVDDSVRPHLGDQARQAGHQFILVDTLWQQRPGMFDGDSTLRVSPTQVRLVVSEPDGQTRLEAPVAASTTRADSATRRFVPFNNNATYIWGDGQEIPLAWMFVIRTEDRPRFLLVRHLRLALPEKPEADPQVAMQLAGATSAVNLTTITPEPGDPTTGATTGVNSGQKLLDITVDNKIPLQISKNLVQGFDFDGSAIVRGEGTARKLNAQTSREVIVDSIYTPEHRRTLRTQIDRQQANSLFGAARVTAASLGGIWLEDHVGEKWYPVGYILQKANGDQKIKIDMGAPLQSARQLPLGEIEPGDNFYLYFSVPRGVNIIAYHAGSQTTQVNLAVPR